MLVKGVGVDEGANSLFKQGGTSVMVHANADDLKTDPAGNAGARIACGMIAKQ
jgi:Cu-Zn family superoxide dismutase